jgi:DNA-binding XRE family transcriptional regulator
MLDYTINGAYGSRSKYLPPAVIKFIEEVIMYISGADLRKMRLDARLTTVRMAKLASVKTRKTYENWEKDIGAPSMNQFIAMCVGCNYNSSKFVKLAIDRFDNAESLNISAARR